MHKFRYLGTISVLGIICTIAWMSGALLRPTPAPTSTMARTVQVDTVDASGRDWAAQIGSERAVTDRLAEGDEFQLSQTELLAYGETLFSAMWTSEDGAGRPLTKGTGGALVDPENPLVFPRNFNRISGPDANSCAGCHNLPYGMAGGSGDFVANVFVLGQRFDFATFAPDDPVPGRGSVDERGEPATIQNIANQRATIGMFGSGYIEMLARQITVELQSIRDSLKPGESRILSAKGIPFGILARGQDGSWDVSQVTGISARSLISRGPENPPDLIIRPFHQSGTVVSLREFTNSAFNHHHGMQANERFGDGADSDGDGIVDELNRADISAVVLFQATMPVPGRVIPNDAAVERAILDGERIFTQIGCAACHMPNLVLEDEGWIFSEPSPFNPPLNLRPDETEILAVDLTDPTLPGPRPRSRNGRVTISPYTDFKLHDITSGADDPNAEPLDLNRAGEGAQLFEGNTLFLTARLWGVGNQPPYFHHGKFTTLREAILAHAGEARLSRRRFEELTDAERDAVVEFLKSLQVLPPGSTALVVDEAGNAKVWPPAGR